MVEVLTSVIGSYYSIRKPNLDLVYKERSLSPNWDKLDVPESCDLFTQKSPTTTFSLYIYDIQTLL